MIEANTGSVRLSDGELLADRLAFAGRLSETFDLVEILRLARMMGLEDRDLALALGVHPRTIRAWSGPDDRGPGRQRDGILALKALLLFLLRRGILTPSQLALWLVEPNEFLGFRRPLAALSEGRIEDVIHASRDFVRPDPVGSDPVAAPPANPAVAAGAAGRRDVDNT